MILNFRNHFKITNIKFEIMIVYNSFTLQFQTRYLLLKYIYKLKKNPFFGGENRMGARLFIKVSYSRQAPMDFNFPLRNALETTFPVH